MLPRLYALAVGDEDGADAMLGRVHEETLRAGTSPFAADRERIVQARAFRRLAGKTQVFTSRASDHFRSRLTHTLEVAQIARRIAGALALNVDLSEALALVHDIGHPPFGHAGERVLDKALSAHGLRFDHNLHALRIAEHFEQRYPGRRGLNLTLAVREGIVKHSRDYPAAEHPELRPYLLDQAPPLEAQIIDLADEIAYLTADLDDGVESGILTIGDVRAHVRLFARAFAGAAAEHPGAEETELFPEALERMTGALVDDLIGSIRRSLEEYGLSDLAALRRHPARIAVFSPAIEGERLEQKRYLLEALYSCPALTLEHEKAGEVVTALFAFWMKYPDELPEGYLDDLPAEGLPRVVADYIAGMTDAYSLGLYAQVKRRRLLR